MELPLRKLRDGSDLYISDRSTMMNGVSHYAAMDIPYAGAPQEQALEV